MDSGEGLTERGKNDSQVSTWVTEDMVAVLIEKRSSKLKKLLTTVLDKFHLIYVKDMSKRAKI